MNKEKGKWIEIWIQYINVDILWRLCHEQTTDWFRVSLYDKNNNLIINIEECHDDFNNSYFNIIKDMICKQTQ